jgi:hypothetical protein
MLFYYVVVLCVCIYQGGVDNLSQLMESIRKKEYKARLTRLPLQLSDDVSISVQVRQQCVSSTYEYTLSTGSD